MRRYVVMVVTVLLCLVACTGGRQQDAATTAVKDIGHNDIEQVVSGEFHDQLTAVVDEAVSDKADTIQEMSSTGHMTSHDAHKNHEDVLEASEGGEPLMINDQSDAVNDSIHESLEKTTETSIEEKAVVSFGVHDFVWNEDKVADAISMGFDAPDDLPTVGSITLGEGNIISLDTALYDMALWDSIEHHGFVGQKVNYVVSRYYWDDFFGELDYNYTQSDKTLIMDHDYSYEHEVVDEGEKYSRYYDPEEGIYYEIQDLLLGNYTDPDSEMTPMQKGYYCRYKDIEGLTLPSESPIALDKGEYVSQCYLTDEEEPTIFFETFTESELRHRWMTISDGVLQREVIYDDEGLVKKITSLVSSEKIEVSHEMFEPPLDVSYQDLTLLIFSLEDGDIETLRNGIESALPTTPFSMVLTNEEGEIFTIHSGGFDSEEMMLELPLYSKEAINMNGETRHLRSFRLDDGYYTICDELAKGTVYDSSAMEDMFFNFNDVGLRSVVSENGKKAYTFYNETGSVSESIDLYTYIINEDEGTLESVNVVMEIDGEPINEVRYHMSEIGEVDETLYEISEAYELYTYGEHSHDDGEHVPFWYQQ